MQQSRYYFFIWVLLLALIGMRPTYLSAQSTRFTQTPPGHAAMSDPLATRETRALYNNLHRLAEKAVIFGHQDDLAYGVHWKYVKDSSDVYTLTSDYPGLYGWDLSGLESDNTKDIDGTPFYLTTAYVKKTYAQGAINTFCWHAPSPLGGGKTAWDTTYGTVQAILPGGRFHARYNLWLDKIAAFLDKLRGVHNERIPILFRPFHECTGNWFWWCANTCTPAAFKSLWRYTIDYLRKRKNLHNLIIVYNTADNFSGPADFLARYPGDQYVDVLSFDTYQYGTDSGSFKTRLDRLLGIVEAVARGRGKLMALAETGYERIPDPLWWTQTLLPALNKHKVSYALMWRNAGEIGTPVHPHMHYYVPVKGDISAMDFAQFYKQPETYFQTDLETQQLYKTQRHK